MDLFRDGCSHTHGYGTFRRQAGAEARNYMKKAYARVNDEYKQSDEYNSGLPGAFYGYFGREDEEDKGEPAYL